MSSPLRIALVGEGPTERDVIEAALKSIFATRRFVLTQLQPEATKPHIGSGWGGDLGTGWGGVLKWCQQQAARCQPNGGLIEADPTLSAFDGVVEADPTLSAFDGVVLQLDADVATFSYANLRPAYTEAEVAAKGWQPLPCPTHCPPAPLPPDDLFAVLLSWLHPAVPGPKTVVCIPAMNTGAWQAAAKLPVGHELLANLECNPNIEAQMQVLPLNLRVNKRDRKSRLAAANAVATRWGDVTAQCARALAFDQAIRTAFP